MYPDLKNFYQYKKMKTEWETKENKQQLPGTRFVLHADITCYMSTPGQENTTMSGEIVRRNQQITERE